MEVTFKHLIQAYKGTCDGLVYYYNRRLQKYIARRKPRFQPNSATRRLSEVAANLKSLKLSEGFIDDLRIYAQLYRNHTGDQNCLGWSNIFSKLMWKLASVYSVDLAELKREQLSSLPIQTVKLAVDAGLLPPVPGADLLTKTI